MFALEGVDLQLHQILLESAILIFVEDDRESLEFVINDLHKDLKLRILLVAHVLVPAVFVDVP